VPDKGAQPPPPFLQLGSVVFELGVDVALCEAVRADDDALAFGLSFGRHQRALRDAAAHKQQIAVI
jgi:hypothetical protein